MEQVKAHNNREKVRTDKIKTDEIAALSNVLGMSQWFIHRLKIIYQVQKPQSQSLLVAVSTDCSDTWMHATDCGDEPGHRHPGTVDTGVCICRCTVFSTILTSTASCAVFPFPLASFPWLLRWLARKPPQGARIPHLAVLGIRV